MNECKLKDLKDKISNSVSFCLFINIKDNDIKIIATIFSQLLKEIKFLVSFLHLLWTKIANIIF